MNVLHFLVFRVRWLRIVLLLFAICVVDVLFQLGLPANTTSSNARIGDIDLVAMKPEDIERTLTAYEDSSFLYILVGDERYIKRFKDVGITIDIDEAKKLADYSLVDKLVPFSALVRYTSDPATLKVRYDKEVARPFIEEIAAYGSSEPEAAQLTNENGRVGVIADIPGSAIDVQKALDGLEAIEYRDRIEFQADSYAVRHDLDEQKASELAGEANQLIDNPPQIKLGEEVVLTPASNMAEWFEIVQNDNKEYELGLIRAEVDEYLDVIARQLFVPSVGAQVTLLDDQEITRVGGVNGKLLDKESAFRDIERHIKGETSNQVIELRLTDIQPGVTYERTYSRTVNGLNVFLKDLARRHGNVAISVAGIDNPNLRADYRGNESMTAASTYKLYVGYYALHRLEIGAASNADKLASGRQLDYCLEQMLVVSSNSCALELVSFFGVASINSFINAAGFGQSSVGPARTTTNNLADFLARMSRMELVGQASYDRFLDMLLRQKLKFGIPTGVSPAQSANKTGNVGAYEHDSAIVYGSKGRYAMAIMMYGERRSELAEISREVHAFVESL